MLEEQNTLKRYADFVVVVFLLLFWFGVCSCLACWDPLLPFLPPPTSRRNDCNRKQTCVSIWGMEESAEKAEQQHTHTHTHTQHTHTHTHTHNRHDSERASKTHRNSLFVCVDAVWNDSVAGLDQVDKLGSIAHAGRLEESGNEDVALVGAQEPPHKRGPVWRVLQRIELLCLDNILVNSLMHLHTVHHTWSVNIPVCVCVCVCGWVGVCVDAVVMWAQTRMETDVHM